ncbi:MAG: TetR/AcrR family transcriptional regulator [Propionibacteriaceae bacterium]
MTLRAQGREQRLRTVRETAGRLFREQGYEMTTVRQIASAAGVSTGTVMSCGDKASLLLQSVEDAIDALMPPVGDGVDPDADPTDLVWRCYAPYFDLYSAVPELARPYTVLLVSAGGNHPALGAQADLFTEIVAGRIRSGHPQVGEEAARLTAEALFAAYLHALLLWVSGVAELETAVAGFRRQIDWQLLRFTA